MLQQTQVSRVLPKYQEFIKRFPTVETLAMASVGDVLRVWKGMGYNRRALYLQNMAKTVTEQYNGKFPDDEELLTELPGLGKYTSRAILIFAYRNNVAAVDTNIRQIIQHFFFNDMPQLPNVIQMAADQLIPHGKSWEWHQALMDYGALELPKMKLQSSVKSKKAIPFSQTNRFYRGKIMDMLRTKSYSISSLLNEFSHRYKKNREEIIRLIDGLTKDGLVEKKGRVLSLPE